MHVCVMAAANISFAVGGDSRGVVWVTRCPSSSFGSPIMGSRLGCPGTYFTMYASLFGIDPLSKLISPIRCAKRFLKFPMCEIFSRQPFEMSRSRYASFAFSDSDGMSPCGRRISCALSSPSKKVSSSTPRHVSTYDVPTITHIASFSL